MKYLPSILFVLLILTSCSDSEDAPVIKEYEIKYEVLSTNIVDAFEVKYYYSTLETSFMSSFEEVWMNKTWEKTVNTSTPDYLQLTLTVLVGHDHTTTLNIYVDNELKETETYNGIESTFYQITSKVE